MALSGLDIYKLLPKTNCRKCGFATCLAFAMQLAKKAVSFDKCPFLGEEAKSVLEASSQPPIKLVVVGTGEERLEVGNETVLFRHEEKFHHPCGIGFIIDDSLPDAEICKRLEEINRLRFERVGQSLAVNLVAVRQKGTSARFAQAVRVVLGRTRLGIVLMSDVPEALGEGLKAAEERKPLLYGATPANIDRLLEVIKGRQCVLVATAPDLEGLSGLTEKLTAGGFSEIVLDTGTKPLTDKIWDFIQIRRQALKKSNRSLGYPLLAVAKGHDLFEEAIEAATYVSKYAGIVLIEGTRASEVLGLLTLRQNIYTDPQKPLQIEPKLYAVGQPGASSPLMVTTNFSLTYYTVLGEVEASKVPSYILSVDTEGMSVLTAWAAEKFNPAKIDEALRKSNAKGIVSHGQLIIPGYVAVMSGELEESSGWKVLVGPKEASGLPSFLKNL